MFDMFGLIKGGSVVQALKPIDVKDNAITGVWASMKNFERVAIVLFADAGAAGSGPVLALQQATDSSGTGAKVLPITNVHYLVADNVAAPGAGEVWTQLTAITRQAPVNSYDTDAIGADDQEMVAVIEVNAEDLDGANGFTHFRLNCAQAGGATVKLGHALYVGLDKARKGQATPTLLS